MIRTRAIVFPEAGKAELREVEIPDPGPWDITVANEATAISVGTERWAYRGLRPDVHFPIVAGYLCTGRVTAAGERVTAFRAGDRVHYMASRQPAGFERNWMCGHLATAVVSTDPAGYVREADLPFQLPVPEGVSPEAAAFASLAGVAMLGVKMAEVRPGETVAVLGLGMVGQFAAQYARSLGARVMATDLDAERVRRAQATGTDAAAEPEFESHARAMAPGGFDVVIDSTGSGEAVNAGVELMRVGGRFVLQGWYPGMTALNIHPFTIRSARILCPCAVRGGDVAQCLAMLAGGQLRADELITNKWNPADAAAAYELLDAGGAHTLGHVFVWD